MNSPVIFFGYGMISKNALIYISCDPRIPITQISTLLLNMRRYLVNYGLGI